MAEHVLPSPHPLTPPRSEEDWLSWLRLLRSRRVGATTFYRLMQEHGSAATALEALPEVAAAAGVEDYRPCPAERAAEEWQAARLAGARPVARGMAEYPAALADLVDAPPVLWALGDTDLLARPMVALVGARNASSLGTRMARKLAGDLAERGFVIVSGLARGVDTAAHMAALQRGTLAVMAGGVDVIYPAENAVLAQEIAEHGLRISEQQMGLQPQARHFPVRNRIIAGLARAVVVVEAAGKSGSLITARDALDQGREVLAVPGHPFDARAAGCKLLIRDGARLVRGADDVIEVIGAADDVAVAAETEATAGSAGAGNETAAPIGPVAPPPPADPNAGTTADDSASAGAAAPQRDFTEVARLHGQILDRLGPSPLAEDQLIRDLELPANAVVPELVTLELEGRIQRQAGGLVSLMN